MDERLAELLTVFDDLDNAAQRMLVALPDQMTEAAHNLDEARLRMRIAIQLYSLYRPKDHAP